MYSLFSETLRTPGVISALCFIEQPLVSSHTLQLSFPDFCRQVCVLAYIDFPSLCLLNNNKWPCPQWSQSLATGRTGSWMCLWRWSIYSAQVKHKLYSHHNILLITIANPSLEAVEPSATSNHWMWWRIQRKCRWERGSARVSPVLVQTLSAASGIEHLKTKRISSCQ